MTAMMGKVKQAEPAQPYDVERIRADFAILSREVYGRPLVYLDNAASAQKPEAVLNAMATAYRSEYANVHRGLHYLSNVATARYEEARECVRRFLNARWRRWKDSASRDARWHTRCGRRSPWH